MVSEYDTVTATCIITTVPVPVPYPNLTRWWSGVMLPTWLDLTWPTLLQVGGGRRRLVGFSSVRFPVRSQKSKTCNPCLGQPRDSVLLPSLFPSCYLAMMIAGGVMFHLLFLLGSASIYPPLGERPTHIAFPRNVVYQVWLGLRGWVSDQRGVRRCKGLHDASHTTTCDKFYERGRTKKVLSVISFW